MDSALCSCNEILYSIYDGLGFTSNTLQMFLLCTSLKNHAPKELYPYISSEFVNYHVPSVIPESEVHYLKHLDSVEP